MTDQELDIFMKRVLLDAVKEENRTQLEEEVPFHASRRYRRQIRGMLADPLAWAHKQRRPVWRSMLQRVAMILVVITVGFGTVVAAVPPVRAAVIQWVTKWYETHITYWFVGDDIAGEMPGYTITALPEGYLEVESDRVEEANYVSIPYRNEAGEVIYFEYLYMQAGSVTDFETENAAVSEVEVNGMEGQLFVADGLDDADNTVVWMDTNQNIQFKVTADLSETDILHIAESVTLDKTTKN